MRGALTDEEIRQLLAGQHLGRLGCHANGLTYIVPLSYAFDGRDLVGHASEGQKIDMVRVNAAVCFEVEDILGPQHWRTGIVWGTFEELEGDEARAAIERLLVHLNRAHGTPADEARVAALAELARTSGIAWRIRVRQMTGRFERPDHEPALFWADLTQ